MRVRRNPCCAKMLARRNPSCARLPMHEWCNCMVTGSTARTVLECLHAEKYKVYIYGMRCKRIKHFIQYDW